MKAEEEKRAACEAAWEANMASERDRELECWQEAPARAEWVDKDARWDAMNVLGSMLLIYAWKWVEEWRWAPNCMA